MYDISSFNNPRCKHKVASALFSVALFYLQTEAPHGPARITSASILVWVHVLLFTNVKQRRSRCVVVEPSLRGVRDLLSALLRAPPATDCTMALQIRQRSRLPSGLIHWHRITGSRTWIYFEFMLELLML